MKSPASSPDPSIPPHRFLHHDSHTAQPMSPPIAITVLSLCSDLAVAATAIAGLVLGTRAGLFRGAAAALLAVGTLILPLALAGPVADMLVGFEVPRRLALAAAHTLLVAGFFWAMRGLVSGTCGQPPRLPTMLDAIGGGVCGAVAGVVVAGTVLVAWSILPVPARLRLDPAGMWLDAGTTALTIFARCAADDEARTILLEGEPRGAGRDAGDRRASETFIDADGDGRHDDDEEYLDTDDNRVFTPRVLFRDVDGDGHRAIGLLERYRLGRWDRVIVVPDGIDGRRSRPPAP